jgi:PAS domain S-box-containing protein
MLEWNQRFADLFQLSQKDLKSMVIFDIIHPNEIESFNKRWDALIHGTGYSGILKAKNKKGEELWLNGSFNVSENASHEIERVVYVGCDVTHEKHLESELHTAAETLKKQEKQIREAEKEQSNKLRELKAELMGQYREVEKARALNEKMLEEMADAIVVTSHDNRITLFNQAAEKLWDINREDVLGQDIGLLFPESVIEKDEILASFVRPGNHKITGKRHKTSILDKKGKQKPVFVLLAKARSDNENAYMALIQYT